MINKLNENSSNSILINRLIRFYFYSNQYSPKITNIFNMTFKGLEWGKYN